MILRRVIKHFRHQEWTAIFLDFLIVVVGVFVGLQVQQWNETRLDREREQILLSRLSADFEAIKVRLNSSIDGYQRFIDSTEYVYQAVETQTSPESKEERKQFANALRAITNSYVPAWPSSTFLEIQGSGNIDLLQSTNLKTALIEYDQTTRIAHNAFGILANRALKYSPPLFGSMRFKANVEALDGVNSFVVGDFDFQKMTGNPNFLPALSVYISVQANNLTLQNKQYIMASNVLRQLEKLEGTK
ncbi:MAG: hypothetical protein COA47_16180 [Robiginitomaculum sp.]|nr:MAG: hypothetical protein COA47_16180 [Robiginitomaculum sp.]